MGYNLLEESKHETLQVFSCNREYANVHRLQQDHPCVLELIRKNFLREPSPPDIPVKQKNIPKIDDPSAGQATAIMRLLRNQSNGFFVECGASDGEFLSNTFYIEKFRNWSGLLIEPDPTSYQSLLTRNRKAWSSNACLSLQPYPTEVYFQPAYQVGRIQNTVSWIRGREIIKVQCFPLYSFLLAHGQTSVDFLSLDVEGHELRVLKTIPWQKVDIKVLAVEWEHIEEGEEALTLFMQDNGFVPFGKISTPYARDIIFIKDFLRDLRYNYDWLGRKIDG